MFSQLIPVNARFIYLLFNNLHLNRPKLQQIDEEHVVLSLLAHSLRRNAIPTTARIELQKTKGHASLLHSPNQTPTKSGTC